MVTAPLSFDEMLHLQPPTWTTSMTDKTPKADALRRMREQGPARIGPFKLDPMKGKLKVGDNVTGGPFGRASGKIVAVSKKRPAKKKGKR